MKVHILIIEHRHGTNFYANESAEGVLRQLDSYIRDWWEKELPHETIPAEREDRIRQYFEYVNSESYILEEVEVLP